MTIDYALLGAGNRGTKYATWVAEHPDRARVVAVADPDPGARDRIGELCGVAPDRRYDSWSALLAEGRIADSAIVATQDADHVGPAVAALELGYDVLLEKPMAPTEQDCRRIVDAAHASGRLFACATSCATRPTRRWSARSSRAGCSASCSRCSTSNRSGGGTSRTVTCGATGATRRCPPRCCSPRAATTSTGSPT